MKKLTIEQRVQALERDVKLLKIIIFRKGTPAAKRAYKELFALGDDE